MSKTLYEDLVFRSLTSDSIISETRDSNGELHSFNDEPALVVETTSKRVISKWFSHGLLSRLESKPPMTVSKEGYYATFNAKEILHSFNDEPALITFSTKEEYTNNYWYKNGYLSREGFKPTGEFTYNSDTSEYWSLYEIPLLKKQVQKIIAHSEVLNCPKWASLLLEIKIITPETFHALISHYDDLQVPLEWVFRFFNLQKNFIVKVEDYETRELSDYNYSLKTLIAIIKTE